MSAELKVALAVLGLIGLFLVVGYLDYRRICRRFERDQEVDREMRERIEALENVVDRGIQESAGQTTGAPPIEPDDPRAALLRSVEAEQHRSHPRGR